MEKCINCGNAYQVYVENNTPIGYKCPTCNLEWTTSEHIDDVTYLIQELNDLKANFNALLEKLGV